MTAALHVTNGDSTDVAGTGLAERILVWRDVLHEGPVPAVPYDELRRIRAAFLTEAGAVTSSVRGSEFALGGFVERDETLAANRDGAYVLWFEADLYCQLQLVEIVARLAELGVPAERITLICIGEYPGIAGFGGLGQLRAEQLRELAGTAACAPLTPAALDLATRAWAALRAPEPDGLAAIVAARLPELRFVGEAYDRLSREYPSNRDGLSLTERRILAAVAGGADIAETAFLGSAAREFRPYLGDTWSFAAMQRLARVPASLLDAEVPVDRYTRLRLTEAGARVLAGDEDHVALNGIDRWIGGVHLHGHKVPWRWDEGSEVVRAA
ncbi:MAG: hypothetical protein AUI14_11330 [Actinobacteria bacterium 13_2_20CM_2_71_6]|nr:MAG: hypothetical protein AUI14_11330 [Actinobacteria bacterium 13_2_20CM_2_71_6]